MPLDDLTVFDFEDAAVRVVTRDGDPWFVAVDVCRILDIANSRDAIAKLDDDEVDDVGITDAIGRLQRMNVVSESGFYALAFTSRKPEAKRFRKWVTATVLPTIRRQGVYVHGPAEARAMPDMARQDVSNWLGLVREARLLKGPGAAARMWAKSPLPSLDDAQPADTTRKSGQIEEFLMECCEVTGNPADRLRSRDLWLAFRDWSDEGGLTPLPERTFYRWLNAMAALWRHPVTGRRIGRLKTSDIWYTGLQLAVGA